MLSTESKSSEKFLYGLRVLMAKQYIDNLGEEVRKGMTEKCEQGIWPSFAPLGYANAKLPSGKNGITPDVSRAKSVAQLFKLYATGNVSMKDLAKWAISEGLTFRKSGRPVNKATIQGILHNPIYTGDFMWRGKLYNGIHDPIISRDLWDQVQSMLRRRSSNRYRVIKHDLPFSGLIRCGHCGCALVGDVKKGKYIYYRCTMQRGRCPEKYARQELIEAQFCEAMNRIVLPEPFIEWAINALQSADKDDQCMREEARHKLTADHQRIEKRLDAIYRDKLDGVITAEMFDRHTNQLRQQMAQLEAVIEHQQAGSDRNYLSEGGQLLGLLTMMPKLFEQQPAREKRELLKFVVSNSVWREGTLTVSYRQPFDLFSTWRNTMNSASRPEETENGQFENWLLR